MFVVYIVRITRNHIIYNTVARHTPNEICFFSSIRTSLSGNNFYKTNIYFVLTSQYIRNHYITLCI